MFKVSKAACDKDGLGVWTVITDCLLHDSGKTPFSLQGWGVIIEECNIKTNKGVMWV
jgi:hypothetical protein